VPTVHYPLMRMRQRAKLSATIPQTPSIALTGVSGQTSGSSTIPMSASAIPTTISTSRCVTPRRRRCSEWRCAVTRPFYPWEWILPRAISPASLLRPQVHGSGSSSTASAAQSAAHRRSYRRPAPPDARPGSTDISGRTPAPRHSASGASVVRANCRDFSIAS
jgi:hypothetical protein